MTALIFSHSILNSSLCDNITTVEFDSYSPETLDFALQNVLPRLTRLTGIRRLDKRVTNLLFGLGGMAANHDHLPVLTSDQKAYYAWRTFTLIAVRIKHWDLELDHEEVEALLSVNPLVRSNLLSLSLSTPPVEGFPILESDASTFPAILGSLPSLTSLCIVRAKTLANDMIFDATVSEFAIWSSYAFASTLTSFTWKSGYHLGEFDLSLLRFLTRFECLQHLRLEAARFRQPDIAEDEPEFPNLTHLELIGAGCHPLDSLLDFVNLPKLVVLTLETRKAWECDKFFDLATQHAEELHWRLYTQEGSLQHVYLGGSKGLYQISLDHLVTGAFQDSRSDPICTLHIDWQPGIVEAVTSDSVAEDPSRSFEIGDEEIMEGVTAGVEELHGWVGDEIIRAKLTGDSAKAKQLLRAMRPVWELREWNKD